jgi:uncharacterized membrane protein YjdF
MTGLFISPLGCSSRYPLRELLMRAAGVKTSWSYLLVIITVLGFSGFYEVLEGAVAVIVSPELGSAYLGTQGDEWDAQKDTALAFSGAVVAMSLLRACGQGRRQSRTQDPEASS